MLVKVTNNKPNTIKEQKLSSTDISDSRSLCKLNK